MKTKQITIDVNGDKIKVKATRKLYGGTLNGFKATVNEMIIPHINVLTFDEAIEKAYVKYVKAYR